MKTKKTTTGPRTMPESKVPAPRTMPERKVPELRTARDARHEPDYRTEEEVSYDGRAELAELARDAEREAELAAEYADAREAHNPPAQPTRDTMKLALELTVRPEGRPEVTHLYFVTPAGRGRYQLRRISGEAKDAIYYCLDTMPGMMECTCADYRYRGASSSGQHACKHIRGLQKMRELLKPHSEA
jgi:hypothetical protein